MRKSIMLIAAMCMTSVMTFAQKTIRVSTDKTDLVMKVSPKGRLYQVYLGDKMLRTDPSASADMRCMPHQALRNTSSQP